MKIRNEKVLEWTFAFLTIIVVWNLKLSYLYESFAIKLGALQGSFLYLIIVDIGLPFSIVFICRIAMLFYERVIWKLNPWSKSRGGWWLYALIPRDSKKLPPVVGYFKLSHGIDSAMIPEGRAFYLESMSSQPLKYRGDWSASRVWIEEQLINWIFTMRAQSPHLEPKPSFYEGFLELRQITDKPIIGKECWSGIFNDLGDRRNIWGPVYAEKLQKGRVNTASDAEKLLKKIAQQFRLRSEKLIS